VLKVTELQHVFRSRDAPLMELFIKHLLVPPVATFASDAIPDILLERESKRLELLQSFVNKNLKCAPTSTVEEKVIYIQRQIRSCIRRTRELTRIADIYFSTTPNAELKASVAMADASTPYRPQKCTPQLAERLLVAASKITLFTTVKHYTAKKTISNVLDGCLYGRQNLNASGIAYRPAALGAYDVKDGDTNVICFGPFAIDSRCLQDETIELEFDLHKIVKINKNPCIFFKQRDFGFTPLGVQYVQLRDQTLTFRYASNGPEYQNYVSLEFLDVTYANVDPTYIEETLVCDAQVPKCHLISYNVANMHEILIMNFFRFLDAMKDPAGETAAEIDRIYAAISDLNDDELTRFLTSVGKKMSISAEFNFYGAYKLDLASLTNVAIYKDKILRSRFTSDEFSTDRFHMCLPEFFQSHRFVQLLASQTG
jgi:hypothetical protein